MNNEETVFCAYRQPMSRRRKAVLYVAAGAAILLCILLFAALFG